jgi:hypothetical protein
MYAAQSLVDGDYSENDLPDAVTADRVSFNRNGTGYGNTTNGVILEGNVWVKYRNGVRSERPCLIQGGVVDQFANSYTVTYTPGGEPRESVVVTRISLCVWRGNDVCGRPWYLMYGDQEPFGAGSSYLWNSWMAIATNVEVPCDDFIQQPTTNTGFQNTPVGSYSGANDATVS